MTQVPGGISRYQEEGRGPEVWGGREVRTEWSAPLRGGRGDPWAPPGWLCQDRIESRGEAAGVHPLFFSSGW